MLSGLSGGCCRVGAVSVLLALLILFFKRLVEFFRQSLNRCSGNIEQPGQPLLNDNDRVQHLKQFAPFLFRKFRFAAEVYSHCHCHCHCPLATFSGPFSDQLTSKFANDGQDMKGQAPGRRKIERALAISVR